MSYDTITVSHRVKHGTVSGYIYGCRCDECKETSSTYYRDWRAAHRDRVSDYNRRYYLRTKGLPHIPIRDSRGRIIRWSAPSSEKEGSA